jgi:hypothetical protein
MEKIADINQFNDTFLDMIREGKTKEASVSAQRFTRVKLRENSFTEKIFTPLDISNDELDKAEDPEFLVKWCSREADTAPAVVVPYGTVPDGFIFKGTNYPVYFSRLTSPMYKKDIGQLRVYDYDIRALMLEISTKEIATTIDEIFLGKVDSVLGSLNTANPLNGLGLPQYVSLPGGITRDSLADAYKVITRLNVPFGPMQPDGGDSKGVLLANTTTAYDLVKFGRSEAGGNVSEDMFINGVIPEKVMGVPIITSIKRDLLPDGVVYLFSSENFGGKYLRLDPLTVYMEQKAYFLNFFQYMQLGISIGNVRFAAKIQF